MTLRRAELDAIRFAPGTLEALVAAIDVNDMVDLNATLPETIALDYPAERFVAGFGLSRQLWQEGFDRRGVIAMAAELRRGGSLDAAGRAWFKQVRARFKHLRFAFFLYSSEHRSPAMLSLVTLVMGELQDATRVGGAKDIRRHAIRLQLLLTAPGSARLVRETDRLAPSDPAGFRAFTLSQIETLRPLVRTTTTGAHAFHAARKVVSRQVSFHDDMRTLYRDTPGHRQMACWLATLNGLMGAFHDDLVARNAAGAASYARDTFVLPDDIRTRLHMLVAFYLGTSNS